MNKIMLKQRQFLAVARLIALLLALAFRAPGQTLYYGTSSAVGASNTVQSVVTNGSGNALLYIASGAIDRCTAVAVDSLNGKIFLADAQANKIWSLDLSGSNLTFINSTAAFVTGLALDAVDQKIYYITSSTIPGDNRLQRMDYTGLNNTTFFTGAASNGVQRCTSLAVDPVNSVIFVGDAGSNVIWSMNLTGGNLSQVGRTLTGAPLDLAVDPVNQVLYYTTSSATQTADTIQRVLYNGAMNSLLFTATGPTGNGVQRCTSLDLDLANARIYFSDAGSNALWSLPLGGGSPTLVKNALTATIKKVRLFAPSSAGTNSHLSYSNLVAATPGLLAYWPFSPATQANSLGNGYTGSFLGTAGIGSAGSGPALFNMPGNTALILNGSSSYVNTSLVGGLNTTGSKADQATIIAWFNLAILPSTAGRFFSIAGESDYANDLDLQIETDNKIKFYTDSGSATVYGTALTATDLNNWFFVAATFNSNITRNIYLNGALVASSVPGGPHNPANGGTFAMGASDVFGGRYFQGALDEIAVFNRALSASEISNLYAAGQGIAFVGLTIQPSGTNVVVSWTDPQSFFSLQSAPLVNGYYTNVPGAASPYSHPAAGAPAFFKLISH
jgi:hypothetical protein